MAKTVEELYREHIIPKKEKAAERERQKMMKAQTPTVKVAGGSGDKICIEKGHYIKGPWCIYTTASGKTLAKCGRCEKGFEVVSGTPPR